MRVSDFLLNLVFPPQCVSCGELLVHTATDALCPHCRAKYEIEKGFRCPECGNLHRECACIPKILSSSVNEALHLTEYMKDESVARDMVLAAKDGRIEYLYRFLTEELSELISARVAPSSEWVFTYVPRSAKRKAYSGVDQSREVAKRLARSFNGEFLSVFTRRRIGEQKLLSARERRENVERAYGIDDKKAELVRGRRVLLYDDVMTTGATLAACARLLKKAGARRVTVVTFGKVYLASSKEKSSILK